ncbi:hypothetical protein D3H35_25260 [Cohnella faecalis]|uniref:Uncharacterized protein n=1 Tax=Cohnella faecalis TaxID=2315694 RepID=A0A398CGB8_9BACL|nr:hypothetical protein D3H35_25260 [Cohnella faecalis]
MAAILCPCVRAKFRGGSQGPDKFCPVCDNEIDGYRTLRIGIDEETRKTKKTAIRSLGSAEDEEDLS